MSLHPEPLATVPQETARATRAVSGGTGGIAMGLSDIVDLQRGVECR
jgi:hypothetical protein